jgi:hypothetical protein
MWPNGESAVKASRKDAQFLGKIIMASTSAIGLHADENAGGLCSPSLDCVKILNAAGMIGQATGW